MYRFASTCARDSANRGLRRPGGCRVRASIHCGCIKHSPSDDFKVTNKIDRVNLEFFISSYKIYRSIKERSVLVVFMWYVLNKYMFIC